MHFWRKVCRACHCSKDVHDVQDDDLSGWAQFELLGTAKPKKASSKYIGINISKLISFDIVILNK